MARKVQVPAFEYNPFEAIQTIVVLVYRRNVAALDHAGGLAGHRYPAVSALSALEHLYWLSRGRPGGHRHWSFLDTQTLTEAYARRWLQWGSAPR